MNSALVHVIISGYLVLAIVACSSAALYFALRFLIALGALLLKGRAAKC